MNLLFYGYCDSKTAHGHSHVNLKFGTLYGMINWSFKNKNSQKFIIKLANQLRTTADILKGVTESYFKKKKSFVF